MRRWLLALAVWGAIAPPAHAQLEESITDFKRSELIKGDTLFKFDGRVGARYHFSGATHCMFGNGLFFLDTVDGYVVQEEIVLPLPGTPRERALIESVMQLFLKDVGLGKDDNTKIWAAFEEGIQAGKTQEVPLGGFFQKHQANVFSNPSLHSILVIVGLKQ